MQLKCNYSFKITHQSIPCCIGSKFEDLDSAMRRLLMQARLSEEDLKDKDVAEAVDYIINQFGGLTAVQRELRKRGILFSNTF